MLQHNMNQYQIQWISSSQQSKTFKNGSKTKKANEVCSADSMVWKTLIKECF